MRTVLILLVSFLAMPMAQAQRITATSNPNVYFAPASGCAGGYWGSTATPVTNCGDDILGDGSMAHPWVTPQLAIDRFYQTYDFAGQYAPTLNLACAAAPNQFYYSGIMVSGLMVGQPAGFPPLIYGDGTPPFPLGKYAPVQILGCPNNQFGAFLNPGAGGRPSAIGLVVAGGAIVKMNGLSIDTTNAQQDCIDIFRGVLDIQNIVFGNASNDQKRIHVGIFQGAMIVNGDMAIAGNAASWIENGQQGTVYWNNNGNPASPMTVRYLGGSFSNGVIYSNNGVTTIANVKWVHSTLNSLNQFVDDATPVSIPGTIVAANQNGVVETGQGCTTIYFPTNSTPGGVQKNIQDHAVCR